jgi:hypothetical protein
MEEDEDGAYLVCIQCGNTETIVNQNKNSVTSKIQPGNKKDLTRVKYVHDKMSTIRLIRIG